MKRKLAVILVLTMGLSLFAACSSDSGSESSADDPAQTSETSEASSSSASSTASGATEDSGDAQSDYTIGFIPIGMNNEYFINMVNGVESYCEEKGIDLVVQASSDQDDVEAQLGYVENMIASGVDAICICPASKDGLVSAIIQCQEAGVYVINIDTALNAEMLEENGCEVPPFFGSDNYVIAQTAAEFLMENFDEGTNIAILTGVDGQENALLRLEGFTETAGDYFNIVATQTANWDVEEGYNAAQNILNANPDLEVFYCCNDSMAIGALRACQEAGRTDIKIIGVDAISEAVSYIESGEIMATVAQHPIEMGVMGIELAVQLLEGEIDYSEVAGDVTDTGCEVITQETAAEYLEYLAEYE